MSFLTRQKITQPAKNHGQKSIIAVVFPRNILYDRVKYGAEKVVTGNTISFRVYPSYCCDIYFPLLFWRLITLSAVIYTLEGGGRGSYCSQNKSHCPPKRHYPAPLYNGDVMCLFAGKNQFSWTLFKQLRNTELTGSL